MKWPQQITIVRHAQSYYNILRQLKSVDPMYAQFKEAYDSNYLSAEAKELAARVRKKYALTIGDAETPITDEGSGMSVRTGVGLKKKIGELPDVIFVSPYLRTNQTLDRIKDGWPELSGIKIVNDDRIREQEHGLSVIYNDWRVFHIMHPEQKILREVQGPYWYQYPQGESVSNVRDRIRSFLNTLTREYSGARVLLVTHHLTILSIRALLERLSPDQFIDLDEHSKPVNCGVTIYKGNPNLGKDGRLELTTYNKRVC